MIVKTKLPAKKRDYNAKKADASYSGNTSLSMTLSPEQGLNRYLQEVRKFPMLERDEEFMLAKRWIEQQDSNAAEKMVTSHLRLVAKIAMGYRGYGLPIGEVISEGNVGLMQAVKKFDPEKRVPSINLCNVVDTSCNSGICTALLVSRKNGYNSRTKKNYSLT